MVDMNKIHDFAVKWCDKFRNQNINYIELVDHWMADDCDALGFEMDCGSSFSEKYSSAVHNHIALGRIIDDVTDVSLLGSAIYSRWRYFNHWAYSGAEILKPENREWFIVALSRLALLSGDNPFILQGTIKKVHIVSNKIIYAPMEKLDEEVGQHLTINNEGHVLFSGYSFGHDGKECEKVRSKNFKIDKTATDKLLGALATYFSNNYTEIFTTDIGDWVMEITNTNDFTYKFRGSLCANFDYEGVDLSDLIRNTIGMEDLYVFDGNCKPDMINKITLDYHRITKIKPSQKPEDAEWEFITWDYTENLIIDRASETLEHIQNIGTGCKVSRKYEIEDGIERLLEKFHEEDLFSHIKGNPEDTIDTPNEIKKYSITIEYSKKPSRTITGSYDKNGLPEDFADFAEMVFDFICFYGLGEILNPSNYNKAKRRKSDYIYCSVIFEEGYKSYYYLTEDDSIVIGDFVLVPVGKDNHETIVKIVNIELFSEENVPLPIEKTKQIIRKCTDEEFDTRT